MVAAAAAMLAAAAVAYASVRVYSNDFSGPGEAGELRIAGKGCSKEWDREHKRLRVQAKGGPAKCRLKLPVQGDAPQPDHTLVATAKVLDPGKTAMARSDSKIYIAVTVRDGAGGRYELRIFPATRRYELRREPEGGEFPVTGRDAAIGKLGERNVLRIEAILDSVKAKVNKKRIGPVLDADAEDLEGTRMTIVLGMEGKSGDPIRAWVDDLQVYVPTP